MRERLLERAPRGAVPAAAAVGIFAAALTGCGAEKNEQLGFVVTCPEDTTVVIKEIDTFGRDSVDLACASDQDTQAPISVELLGRGTTGEELTLSDNEHPVVMDIAFREGGIFSNGLNVDVYNNSVLGFTTVTLESASIESVQIDRTIEATG